MLEFYKYPVLCDILAFQYPNQPKALGTSTSGSAVYIFLPKIINLI
jgi:hypothetical protein